MIVGADGACNGCSVHRNKLGSGWSIANRVFGHFHRAAHKTRGGAEGRWAQKYLKNRKKSNAYFGKSLVRLACNQEKNKEKSDRKMKIKRNQLQEETAESTNRRAEQSLSDGTHYHMACSSSSKERRRAHCRGDKKTMKGRETKKKTSDLKQMRTEWEGKWRGEWRGLCSNILEAQIDAERTKH